MKGKKITAVLLSSGLIFILSCQKDVKKMAVNTGTESSVLANTAVVSGTIIDLGEGANKYGHCYSTTANPTVDSTKKEMTNPALGDFTSTLGDLIPNTTYYVKAYLGRGNDVVYGEQKEFETASDTKPQLTTKSIISKTKTSAVTGGDITNEGGTPITAKGVCWSLSNDPTIDGNSYKTTDGSGTGSFNSNMTGLSAGTYYYVKAYATNDGGTSYGNQVEFWTESDANTPPTVTTVAITSVTATTAVCGGNVINEGGSSVNHKGVCWSSSDNPTTTNYHSDDGTGGGLFVSNIPGGNPSLTPGTLYHVRAYATNNTGVPSYGTPELTFITCRAPLATTNAATYINDTTASLNGQVNANSVNDSITKVTFEYGLTISYGNTVAATPSSLTGSSNTAVSAGVSGLTPKTTYYYRVKAVNCGGTSYGADLTFTTLDDPSKIEYQAIQEYLSNNPTYTFEQKPSGLYYYEMLPGLGPFATNGNIVSFWYSAYFLDGTLFDTNISSYDPLTFTVGSGMLIQGLEEGVKYMKKGEKALFLIPSNLAYGAAGSGDLVLGYTPLLFEIELVEIL